MKFNLESFLWLLANILEINMHYYWRNNIGRCIQLMLIMEHPNYVINFCDY
jgi:hypothetical protein